MRNNFFFLLVSFVILICSCKVNKPFYNKHEADWDEKKMPSGDLKYEVYLMGEFDDKLDSLNAIQEMLKNQTEGLDSNHAIIYLSDCFHRANKNVFKKASLEEYERKIDLQLDYLKKDKGRVMFIAGNCNLNNKESYDKNTELIKNHINEKLEKGNIFFPEYGCPEPLEITVTNDLILLPLNTNWWIQDLKEKNKVCQKEKISDWVNEIKDVVDNNQRKNILVLGHHPLFDAGNYGGRFSLKQHFFPLTDLTPNLYIPLPVLGSLYLLLRTGIGTKKDFSYPRYKELRKNIFTAIKDYNNVIYASGHEHNIQYFKYNKQDFIISNSASDVSWVGRNKKAYFTYAASGFIKLSYLKNGEVWMQVFIPDKNEKGGKVVYQKRLKDNVYGKPNDSTIIDSASKLSDSTLMIAADEHLKAGKFKQLLLGKHYRLAWTTPIVVPVIDLRTEQGGLEILKKGGGFQTKSLHLQNSKGEEFVFRSVNKYPERLLGQSMNHTLAADVLKDQTSSSNPYAPYVVDKLSEIAGVLHTNPKLVYIPNDVLLKEYRKDFANTLALFEEKIDGKVSADMHFGNIKSAINSQKMLDRLHKDNENSVDDYFYLRSRLFDMWINDWDRHENQWTWGVIECTDSNREQCESLKAKKEYYVPIPKDRDQAFSKFDGIIPWLAGRKWILRKFQDFNNDIRDVAGFNFNARNIDHSLLTKLSKSEWDSIAHEMKSELTDEKIDKALLFFPPEIYKLYGKQISDKLKARRDRLPIFASKYYRYLAKHVDVLGSNKQEIFEVTRINDELTSVKVFSNEEKQDTRLLYARLFKTVETKEVRLYGFGGEDVFKINGSVNHGILIRIIGGEDNDSITDLSHVRGLRRKTRVYDNIKTNYIKLGTEAKDLTSNSKSINDYDFYANDYNLLAPATYFGFNVDDGLFIGGGFVVRHHSFRKKPYANFQRFIANMAVFDKSFNIKYTGDFNDVYRKWGVNIDFSILAPKSTTNFFGLGNNTINKNESKSYYRIRFDELLFYPGVKRHLSNNQYIKMGPTYEFIKIENTADRFLSTPEGRQYVTDFTAHNIAGGKLEYEFQSINDSTLTFRGLKLITEISSESDLEKSSMYSVNFKGQLCIYIPLGNSSTLAVRAGGASRLGNFEFYQSNTLGGQNFNNGYGNLRGYLSGRYSGRSVAYLNTDIRIKLFAFHTYLFPAHFGILGFYDEGRVWSDDESSDKWHNGYGGGIWLDPFGKSIINLSYAISKEDKILNFGIGFLF